MPFLLPDVWTPINRQQQYSFIMLYTIACFLPRLYDDDDSGSHEFRFLMPQELHQWCLRMREEKEEGEKVEIALQDKNEHDHAFAQLRNGHDDDAARPLKILLWQNGMLTYCSRCCCAALQLNFDATLLSLGDTSCTSRDYTCWEAFEQLGCRMVAILDFFFF